jgi:hypothetical protein
MQQKYILKKEYYSSYSQELQNEISNESVEINL